MQTIALALSRRAAIRMSRRMLASIVSSDTTSPLRRRIGTSAAVSGAPGMISPCTSSSAAFAAAKLLRALVRLLRRRCLLRLLFRLLRHGLFLVFVLGFCAEATPR